MPILVKGVITAEDGNTLHQTLFLKLRTFLFDHLKNLAARIAVEYGAAGIIVSNHGARQLDYVPATIMALEEVYISAF